MKEVNKGILDNDMVISAENIQKMGEVIALTCIKTVIVRAGKDLNHLYVRLIDDINHSKNNTRPFSDAYDTKQLPLRTNSRNAVVAERTENS